MANTMTLISSYTVGSGGITTFNFSSIPNTYTDLILKLSVRVSETGIADVAIRFNSDTGSNYAYREIYGTGATAGGGANTGVTRHNSITMGGAGITANTFDNIDIYISNYIGTQPKTSSVEAVTENNTTSTDVQLRFQSWSWSGSTDVSTITIFDPAGGTMLQNSTAYLYGIKNS